MILDTCPAAGYKSYPYGSPKPRHDDATQV